MISVNDIFMEIPIMLLIKFNYILVIKFCLNNYHIDKFFK